MLSGQLFKFCNFKNTKNVLVLFALSVAVILTTPGLGSAYEQEINQLSAELAVNIFDAGKKTVGVVDFTDLQGNVTELGRFLADELSVALAVRGNDVEVIDRTHLKSILQEHKLSTSGLIDPKTARKLGQIAGLDALVTATATPFGDSVRLSVKVLDTSSARILGASTANIPKTKAIEELLSRGVLEGNSSTGGRRRTSASSSSTRSTSPTSAARESLSVQHENYIFTARGCEKTGGRVTCTGTVVSKASKASNFSLYGSYLIDNLGTQASDRTIITLGSRGYTVDLPPEVPMKFTFSGKGFSPEANSFTLVIRYSDGVYGGARGNTTLRNVPLDHN